MINLKEFLKSQDKSFYAFVTYNGITEPTYFSLIWDVIEPWFLESPCELQFYRKKAVVENFQVAPYLWEYEIEDVRVVREKEVLKYLLKERGVIKSKTIIEDSKYIKQIRNQANTKPSDSSINRRKEALNLLNKMRGD